MYQLSLTGLFSDDDDTSHILRRAGSEAATEGRGDTGIFPLPEDMDEPTFALPLPQAAQPMSSSPAVRNLPSSPVPQRQSQPQPEPEPEPHPMQEDDIAAEDQEQDEADDEIAEPTTTAVEPPQPRPIKPLKTSRFGIPYPSLPAGVVKRIATTVAPSTRKGKLQISKDTLGALIEASDVFFEQVSDDLGAYAEHAGRQTIDERDMITLMKR